MQQLLDQWDDDSLLTMLRVLGASFVLRHSLDDALIIPVSMLLGKAAKRLSRFAAGYEQQLAQLQQSSQHGAQPLLSVKELEYVALALQCELLQHNVSPGLMTGSDRVGNLSVLAYRQAKAESLNFIPRICLRRHKWVITATKPKGSKPCTFLGVPAMRPAQYLHLASLK